jgi:hypothetical protein
MTFGRNLPGQLARLNEAHAPTEGSPLRALFG